MRLMMYAASLPRPFRMTRSGLVRTLFAFSAIPMAPSAAAKDSWPARKEANRESWRADGQGAGDRQTHQVFTTSLKCQDIAKSHTLNKSHLFLCGMYVPLVLLL